MKKPKSYQIPFDNKGNQLHYVDAYTQSQKNVVWRDVFEFEARLTIFNSWRGRSSVGFHLRDEQGHTYCLTFSEFMKILETQEIKAGRLPKLKWTFIKKGQNYNLQVIL